MTKVSKSMTFDETEKWYKSFLVVYTRYIALLIYHLVFTVPRSGLCTCKLIRVISFALSAQLLYEKQKSEKPKKYHG